MIRANVSGAIARFRRLSQGLRRAAEGLAHAAAAAQLGAELLARAGAALDGHDRSGSARASLAVEASVKGVRLTFASYLDFQPWWPLRDGMPADVAPRARVIFREQVRRLLAL